MEKMEIKLNKKLVLKQYGSIANASRELGISREMIYNYFERITMKVVRNKNLVKLTNLKEVSDTMNSVENTKIYKDIVPKNGIISFKKVLMNLTSFLNLKN
jgi:hypothetical protein